MNASVQDVFAEIVSTACDDQGSDEATLACLEAAEDAIADALRVSIGRYANARR